MIIKGDLACQGENSDNYIIVDSNEYAIACFRADMELVKGKAIVLNSDTGGYKNTGISSVFLFDINDTIYAKIYGYDRRTYDYVRININGINNIDSDEYEITIEDKSLGTIGDIFKKKYDK